MVLSSVFIYLFISSLFNDVKAGRGARGIVGG
jgi:hypothetical protein